MLERRVEARLAQEVKGLNGLYIKLESLSANGLPDRLVILPNNNIWLIEVKKPKGYVLSKKQKYQINKLNSLGAKTAVLKSYADIEEWMKVAIYTT